MKKAFVRLALLTGLISMDDAAYAQGRLTAQSLLDRAEIVAIVDGIDAAVDAKDWARARAYFTDQIEVDFSSLSGAPAARIPADSLIGGWRRNLYAEKASHHMRTNHQVTLSGDRAEVLSKGYAFNRLPSALGSDLWEVWGDYRHSLSKTREGWRVTGMTLKVTHAQGNERARDFVPGQ